MDRDELKLRLKPFQEKCAAKGRPLTNLCIEDAFPGDTSTSFIIEVKAPWVDGMYCTEALDFLFDTLWETVDEAIRAKIFSIHVLNADDELHCLQEAKDVGK